MPHRVFNYVQLISVFSPDFSIRLNARKHVQMIPAPTDASFIWRCADWFYYILMKMQGIWSCANSCSTMAATDKQQAQGLEPQQSIHNMHKSAKHCTPTNKACSLEGLIDILQGEVVETLKTSIMCLGCAMGVGWSFNIRCTSSWRMSRICRWTFARTISARLRLLYYLYCFNVYWKSFPSLQTLRKKSKRWSSIENKHVAGCLVTLDVTVASSLWICWVEGSPSSKRPSWKKSILKTGG